MKSVRLRIAAKLLWVFGLLACLIGCGTYAILCLPEVLNLPFEPLYLAAAGILALLIWIVAAILAAASKRAARAEELEARLLEEEAALAAVEEQEMEICPEEETAVAETAPKKLTEKVLAKLHLKPEALTLAKKAATVVVPVVATCVVAGMISKSKKKKAQEKNRQAFYRWLG